MRCSYISTMTTTIIRVEVHWSANQAFNGVVKNSDKRIKSNQFVFYYRFVQMTPLTKFYLLQHVHLFLENVLGLTFGCRHGYYFWDSRIYSWVKIIACIERPTYWKISVHFDCNLFYKSDQKRLVTIFLELSPLIFRAAINGQMISSKEILFDFSFTFYSLYKWSEECCKP